MDPDANWQEQQQIKSIPVGERDAETKARLRDLQRALREWIANGGFPPNKDERT